MTAPEYRVTDSTTHFQGSVFSAHTDIVAMPDGTSAVRDYVNHRGAVAAVAVDDENRVVLVRQYRHPVRTVLWELPAGLLEDGEDHAEAAARELAEEAGYVAARWEPLISFYTSPGYSNERLELYLARGLSATGPEFTFNRVAEEAQMTTHLVPLDEALSMVDRGEIVNGVCVIGLFAAARRLRS